MDGYLLDTCAAAALWDIRHRDHNIIKDFLKEIPDESVFISVIGKAEVEMGLKCRSTMTENIKTDIRNEMEKYYYYDMFSINKHTVLPYSDIKAQLFNAYSPQEKKKRAKWPEDLIDPVSAKSLGVQENDIWLASQAIQHNLILVTADRMSRIAEASISLGLPLKFVDFKKN
jgi:tRNA(fMet)-specific endonuclease VapC